MELDSLYANGKVNGLLQAQVIALTAAQMYPNHRSVCQIIAEKIAAAASELTDPPQAEAETVSSREDK